MPKLGSMSKSGDPWTGPGRKKVTTRAMIVRRRLMTEIVVFGSLWSLCHGRWNQSFWFMLEEKAVLIKRFEMVVDEEMIVACQDALRW